MNNKEPLKIEYSSNKSIFYAKSGKQQLQCTPLNVIKFNGILILPFYSQTTKEHVWLMLSVSLNPKVIPLSIANCVQSLFDRFFLIVKQIFKSFKKMLLLFKTVQLNTFELKD